MSTRAVLLALSVLCAASCSEKGASAKEPLTVFAATSLRAALEELAPVWRAEHGQELRLQLAASNLLAQQVLAGARADVFISADGQWMDAVAEKGAIDPSTRVDLLANSLVIVQPAPLPADVPRVSKASDLAEAKLGRVSLADPQAVPAGRYARAWLEGLGLWDEVGPRVAPAVDARAALAVVESGACGAGVVYATDGALTRRAAVALAVPEGEGPRIRYPAAALAEASDPAAARAFLEFLRGGRAREAFTRAGFRVLVP